MTGPDARFDDAVDARRLTARQLNRATLQRQFLLDRVAGSPSDVLRQLVAVQAQEPASPYLALWNRIDRFDPRDLDRQFRERTVVRATLMRVTLHAVHVDDYPAFHLAMQPTLRAARLNDRRFRETGLTAQDADRFLATALRHAAEPRPNNELEALHDEPRMWWALRHYGPFWRAPTEDPWAFGPKASYVSATTEAAAGDPDAALATLIDRYLRGFGPAGVADIGQYLLVPRGRLRPVTEQMDLTTYLGPAGEVLLDVPGATIPTGDEPAPARLLPMWESVLLAHADRTRIIPEGHRAHVIRRNGDTLPTVLVDGQVAGVWRPASAGGAGIEVTAFEPLSDGAWDELESEARTLVALLAGREATVYRRYRRWWDKGLPAVEVRVLGA